MKSIYGILLGLLVSTTALATTVSMTCTGHELRPGNQGQTAPITFTAVTHDTTTFGKRWTLDVQWKGDSSFLLTDGEMCGHAIDFESKCSIKSETEVRSKLADSGPVQFVKVCEDKTDFPPYHFTRAGVTLDSSGNHGRFFCSLKRSKVSVTVELSDCRKNEFLP